MRAAGELAGVARAEELPRCVWFHGAMVLGSSFGSRRVLAAAAATLLISALASSCGDDSGSVDGGDGDTTLTVYAAASLTKTFEELGEAFEAEHEGVQVEFSFGGSSDLVSQLQEGAPADVFASADTANMDKLTGDDLQASEPQDFATNTLEIATPPDNPAGIASFADLAGDGVKVVVCAPEVPCGAATQKMEELTGVTLAPVSEEQSVTDVLNKVQTGEADAGLVYVTDVKAAGDKVKGIAFPESTAAVNTYPIGALADSKNKTLAKQFVDLVTGADGQQILSDAGFAKP
jgi:molybdate transport system substrate-binding protein